MSRTRIKSLLESGQIGSEVVVKGWVKAFRNNQFIQINDGSTINNIQAVIEFENFDEEEMEEIKAKQISLHEQKFWRKFCNVQAVILLTVTTFYWGFFSYA